MPLVLKAILLVINLVAIYYLIIANPLKIFEQTSTKLIFLIRPKVFLGIGILFSQLVIFFLFQTFITTSITQLSCDRYPHNISISNLDVTQKKNHLSLMCTLTENNWLSREKTRTLISDLVEAKLEVMIKSDSQNKPNYRYRVLLSTPTNSIPFTHNTSGDFKIEELRTIVSSINNFLARPVGEDLVVRQDDSLLSYVEFAIALFWGILALLVTAAGLFINCNFDKEANIIKVSRYRWFGMLGKRVFQYSLNEIVDVKDQRTNTSESEYFYQAILILESGDNLPLTPAYTSSYINGDYIVRVIKEFLELK